MSVPSAKKTKVECYICKQEKNPNDCWANRSRGKVENYNCIKDCRPPPPPPPPPPRDPQPGDADYETTFAYEPLDMIPTHRRIRQWICSLFFPRPAYKPIPISDCELYHEPHINDENRPSFKKVEMPGIRRRVRAL
jgi:hypothetical protein